METQNTEDIETQEAEEYSETEIPPKPTQNIGQTYALLCHIAAPIIWPWKRREFLLVDIHGRAALNHMISCAGLFIATGIMLWVLAKTGLISGRVSTFIQLPILLASIGYSIFGVIKADEGVLIKYPFPFRWVERLFQITEIQADEEPRGRSNMTNNLDD